MVSRAVGNPEAASKAGWRGCAHSQAGLLWPVLSANRLAPSSLSLITVVHYCCPSSPSVTTGSVALEMRDRLFYLGNWSDL